MQSALVKKYTLTDLLFVLKIYNFCFTFTEAKQISHGPVLIGSGVTILNLHNYIHCDGLIIGSHFKENGRFVSIYKY